MTFTLINKIYSWTASLNDEEILLLEVAVLFFVISLFGVLCTGVNTYCRYKKYVKVYGKRRGCELFWFKDFYL